MVSKFVVALLSFFLLHESLYALNIAVNSGRDGGENFSNIHIKESFEFSCASKKNERNEIIEVQCLFPREPKEKFEKIKTNFFTIDSFSKGKKYYVRILAHQKMSLIPIAHKLYEKTNIQAAYLHTRAKHWMIVGYANTLPLINIETTPALGINFPISMNEVKNPSVGALDIDGMPIRLNQVKDVSGFMRIKAAYDAGNYTNLAKDVDELFQTHPNTIFRAELLLYKMRGYHHSEEYEALLEGAKEFLREYSDDENMPEVLAYTANAYSMVGLQQDGEYFYERLFQEHADSKFAALGMIFLGDQYMQGGKLKEASSYFERALYKTSDVEVASMAAIRLAKMSLDKGDLERSSELYMKIIEGNAKYLLHDVAQNYDNARAFANRGKQKTAVAILQAITKVLPSTDDYYEGMIKDIGLWLAETEDKPSAYKALKTYASTYGEGGEYMAEVQEALDTLFYVPEDANKTALIAEYDGLREKYQDEEIAQKAALQKAKLLYDEKRYQEVLDLEGSGAENEPGYFELKQQAALVLVEQKLKEGECSKAVSLSKEHNVTLEAKHDGSLYHCAYETGNYALAKSIASKHLKDKERLMWLYSYAKTLNKTGEYEALVKVAEDVLVLSDLEKTKKYDDILHDQFHAFERLKNKQGMITSIKELEARRGLISDDIELYVSMIALGLKEKDDVIIQSYANKVMQLQEKTNSFSQSPFVEFAALDVLKRQGKQEEQLALLNKLVKRDLSDKQKSRVQYLFGSILMKQQKNAQAKAAFEASIRADESSAWAGLAKDALALLE